MLGILFNVLNKPRYYLLPTYSIASINDIKSNHLEGIKYIVFDKDDTLTFLKSNIIRPQLRKKYFQLINNYKCIIVSNGKDNPDNLQGLQILKTKDKKPFNFDEISNYFSKISYEPLKRQQIMLIGDRLLTDVYMANTNRTKSILVQKLQESTIQKHGIYVVILRKLQQWTLKILHKNN